LNFANKYFKTGVIRREDVRTKLMEMEPARSNDRKRMAVPYFFTSIIVVPTKTREGLVQLMIYVLGLQVILRFIRHFYGGGDILLSTC